MYEYMVTYILTPWNTALLEKLTGLQLLKIFPAFYETRKYITALKSAPNSLYHKPAQFSPYPHNPLSEDPS
jgi:hypothetical protein